MNKTTTDACLDLLFSQCFALYCTAVKVFYCFKCCKAFNTCRHWNFRPNNFFWVSEMSFLINVYEIGMLLYCKWYMNIMYKGRFHSYYKIETNKIYRYMYRYIMLQVNTYNKYNWHKHSKLSEKSYKIFPWASNFFASNIATSSERNNFVSLFIKITSIAFLINTGTHIH